MDVFLCEISVLSVFSVVNIPGGRIYHRDTEDTEKRTELRLS